MPRQTRARDGVYERDGRPGFWISYVDEYGKRRQQFIRACQAANIEDFSLHDLRHTFASQLRMKGADLHTVGRLLGHKDLRMTARYSHLNPEYLGTAASKLDEVFTNPLTIGPGERK